MPVTEVLIDGGNGFVKIKISTHADRHVVGTNRFREIIPRLFHTELEAVYEEKNRSLDNDYWKTYEALLAEDNKRKEAETTEIHIPAGARLGNIVIEADHLSKAYGDKLLIDDLSFNLPRGGIVGVLVLVGVDPAAGQRPRAGARRLVPLRESRMERALPQREQDDVDGDDGAFKVHSGWLGLVQ